MNTSSIHYGMLAFCCDPKCRTTRTEDKYKTQGNHCCAVCNKPMHVFCGVSDGDSEEGSTEKRVCWNCHDKNHEGKEAESEDQDDTSAVDRQGLSKNFLPVPKDLKVRNPEVRNFNKIILQAIDMKGGFAKAFHRNKGGKRKFFNDFISNTLPALGGMKQDAKNKGRTLERKFNQFVEFAEKILAQNHATGDGADGEDIDDDILLYSKMKHNDDSQEASRDITRKKCRCVQADIIGDTSPLSGNSSRSQVASENKNDRNRNQPGINITSNMSTTTMTRVTSNKRKGCAILPTPGSLSERSEPKLELIRSTVKSLDREDEKKKEETKIEKVQKIIAAVSSFVQYKKERDNHVSLGDEDFFHQVDCHIKEVILSECSNFETKNKKRKTSATHLNLSSDEDSDSEALLGAGFNKNNK